ncbi:MAG TPA: bacterial transcriptional activator domain-containing protein [Blastococcus sp.]|nr:bacterial transcriptional activator domain-containing protein [Blastococcus sp.]
MASSARVQLCGRFVLEWDGQPVEAALPGRQGRLLAAYLLLRRPYPASRDELIDALWPLRPPPNASPAINALLSKIRGLLGAKHVPGRREVCLVLPPDSRVDVEDACAALHEAQSALALGDWPRAWPTSLTALFVTRRPLLPDTDLAWAEEWRQRLAVVHVEALECYATACLHVGGTELPSAVRAARDLVRLAPLRESGHRTLMDALAAGGNVAEALTAYDALRHLLREELGVPPSPQLQDAHAHLLAGRPR